MNICQFKLSNGDQVICKVVGEPQSEEDINIVTVFPMQVTTVIDPADNKRYAVELKPWMLYADQSESFVLINFTHIVGETKPNPMLVGQYLQTIQQYERLGAERDQQYDKMINNIVKMGAEHKGDPMVDEMIQSHRDSKELKDSIKSAKVIPFKLSDKDKDKLH